MNSNYIIFFSKFLLYSKRFTYFIRIFYIERKKQKQKKKHV